MQVNRIIGILLLLAVTEIARSQGPQSIIKLKDLCIDTTIAAQGNPQAVIVAPPGERYADAIETIQEAIRKCSNVKLPVRRDTPNPEEILKEQNVIALGNMATNSFVEHMYRQW